MNQSRSEWWHLNTNSVKAMLEKAIELLTALGIEGAAEDPLLSLIADAVDESLKNKTNQKKLPKELTMTGAFRIVGQYLRLLKNSGKLTELNGMTFETAVKQIQEGDTNVVFGYGSGDMTPQQQLEAAIDWLLEYGKDTLYRHRRLVWD